MCGISGLIDFKRQTNEDILRSTGIAMAKAMYLRGPDAQGVWVDAEKGICLSHARLSVMDLSDAGLQPMTSANGRYVIVYNGEIYNTDQLLEELNFNISALRGHSDTEVLLEAIASMGVERTVSKLIGMFAFALWDKQEKSLTLVRDRFGIKPFYFAHFNDQFLFGSELKALMACPNWKKEIDRDALASYLRFNYVPAPQSIFENVKKLRPGHIMVLSENGTIETKSYWNQGDIAINGFQNGLDISDREAENHLDDLIRDSVKRRMVADVPLGAFLSGGIDSSVVVAAMQAQSARPIKTFTIGFDVEGYDESAYAKAIANHLGTDHTELRLQPDHALDVIPSLAEIYDEPFADSSQIPTFLVSQLARQDVTVSLSGDGGDELFAGYVRHYWGETLWNKTSWIPRPVAKLMAKSLRHVPEVFLKFLNNSLPLKYQVSHVADKINKLADVFDLNDPVELYLRLVTVWEQPQTIIPGVEDTFEFEWGKLVSKEVPEVMEMLQLLDGLTYLPDDILQKVDRASMAVSLEARVPLLDHRIAEFAYQLPRDLRYRNGQGKWILRNVLARYVPRELFERPKMGFGIPVNHWLRGPLRDWAEELLSEQSLSEGGYLNPQPIRKVWSEHLTGRHDWTTHLWTILMFQSWRCRWRV